MVASAEAAGSGQPLKLVFCGTPQFAVPTLEALIAAGHEIPLILTQPDRPVGRKQILTAPPVKQIALAHGIEVMQPEKIKNNLELRARLEAMQPDAIVVVAYGRIIPKWMLDLPRLGCINLHGSLLPKYRGAAPIQWAVANGESVTGNTTMLLAEGLDTGPILLQQETPILPEQTAADLFGVLSIQGAPLVVETLAGLANGTILPVEQEDSLATVARILDREDGRMDFAARTAAELWNRWRGFQPWPGAFTTLHEKKLIVTKLQPVARETALEPGEIFAENGRFLVGCALETVLELLEVQPEGRNRMAAAEFLRGNALAAGSRLG
jgi:methionyl-tRNA formyltransferase